MSRYQEPSSTLQHKQPSLIIQDVDDLHSVGDGGDGFSGCICAAVSARLRAHWCSSVFPRLDPDRLCRLQRPSGVPWFMQLTAVLHLIYSPNGHRTHAPCWISHGKRQASQPVCPSVGLCAGVGVFFLQCCPAYLWIIIPLWNVTFQTHWPQVDHTVVMVCVCVRERGSRRTISVPVETVIRCSKQKTLEIYKWDRLLSVCVITRW